MMTQEYRNLLKEWQKFNNFVSCIENFSKETNCRNDLIIVCGYICKVNAVT